MSQAILPRLSLHQKWASDLPLKFLWGVNLYGREGATMTDVGTHVRSIITATEGNSLPVNPSFLTQ